MKQERVLRAVETAWGKKKKKFHTGTVFRAYPYIPKERDTVIALACLVQWGICLISAAPLGIISVRVEPAMVRRMDPSYLHKVGARILWHTCYVCHGT